MSWRIRQFFRNYGKFVLIGALLFTGYSHVTGGGGSAGRFVRSSTRWIYNVPVAGSFLKSGRTFTRQNLLSYSKSSSKRYGKASRRGRRNHGRRSRRRH